MFPTGRYGTEPYERNAAMNHHAFLVPLEKALRVYAVLAVVIILTQGLGLLMYLSNVWPRLSLSTSTTSALLVLAAVLMGFVRSYLWIRIYWNGANGLSIIRSAGASAELTDRLVPILGTLTKLLVTSCVLDFLFLPAYFMADLFFPFQLAGWRLGLVELARVLFPQAFGFAALILAFLTHQYGQLLMERARLQHEVDLTI
jgi:hypothetical protein